MIYNKNKSYLQCKYIKRKNSLFSQNRFLRLIISRMIQTCGIFSIFENTYN